MREALLALMDADEATTRAVPWYERHSLGGMAEVLDLYVAYQLSNAKPAVWIMEAPPERFVNYKAYTAILT